MIPRAQFIESVRQQRSWWANLSPEARAAIIAESAITQTLRSMAIEGEPVTRELLETAVHDRSPAHALAR